MRNTNIKYVNITLKEYRVRAGLTPSQVAGLLKLQCDDRICRWERGTAATNIDNLFKLSELFQVAPEMLYPAFTIKASMNPGLPLKDSLEYQKD